MYICTMYVCGSLDLITYVYLCFTATIVSFSHSQYNIIEGNITVKPMIVLSNAFPCGITIHVASMDDTATGKYRFYL